MSQLIDNKYLILRDLGGGAAGSVHEASVIRDTENRKKGERVAIKLYKPWVLAHPGSNYRIDQELRAGLKLEHPNIVKTLDLGGHGDTMYLVMEFLQGPTLRDWLSENPEPSFSEVMTIASGLAKGLSFLHQNGFVHRDIKPENIVVTGHRGPVILDLGVIHNSSHDTLLTGQEFLGTIRYAAPEYLFGIDCSALSDVYSFGLIVLEMILREHREVLDDYWSMSILDKADGVDLDANWLAGNNYSTKERAFLTAVVDGCVQDGWTVDNCKHHSISRLSSKQLAKAFEGEVWQSSFLYPVRRYLQSVSPTWPDIPNDVQDEVDLFVLGKKKLPRSGIQIIRSAAEQEDGALNEIIPSRLSQTYRELYEELGKLGLIEWGEDNYGVGCWENITPLAWQLVFRDVI